MKRSSLRRQLIAWNTLTLTVLLAALGITTHFVAYGYALPLRGRRVGQSNPSTAAPSRGPTSAGRRTSRQVGGGPPGLDQHGPGGRGPDDGPFGRGPGPGPGTTSSIRASSRSMGSPNHPGANSSRGIKTPSGWRPRSRRFSPTERSKGSRIVSRRLSRRSIPIGRMTAESFRPPIPSRISTAQPTPSIAG